MDESIFDLIDDAGTIITLRPSVENTRKFEEIANKFESYLKNLNDETIDALTGPENKTCFRNYVTKIWIDSLPFYSKMERWKQIVIVQMPFAQTEILNFLY